MFSSHLICRPIDVGRCELVDDQGRPIARYFVNVAGCGSMLKDYGHHWHDDRQNARARFAAKVKDVSEFLDTLGLVPPPKTLEGAG